MKFTTTLSLFFCIIGCHVFCLAQESINYLEQHTNLNEKQSQLTNTDTISDYLSAQNKLKISGIIYKSDGVTPAENVILYIEHANENGDFELRKTNDKRYVYHNASIKTGADGRYTIFTFVPGNDRRYSLLKQLFPIVKTPSNHEYALDSFLFKDDYLLTKLCRKRLSKRDELHRILEPKLINGILEIKKNIVLKDFHIEQ